MGQKISEMTDVVAGALSTDQMELARSSSGSSFRITLSALATFIKAFVAPLVGTTLTITGVAAFSAGITVSAGTTAVQALTTTTIAATGAISTTGINGVSAASRAVIDYLAGARFQSYGGDAATNGVFALISRRSDGSNVIMVMTSDTTGSVSFPIGVTSAGQIASTHATAPFAAVGTAATLLKYLGVSGTTTGAAYQRVGNTSGDYIFGVESNTGGVLLTGSTAYATVLTSVTATVLQLGANDTVGMTLAKVSAGVCSATFTGAVKSSDPSGGVGYATGAGGTVTQLTSKGTGVTLNKATGLITLNAAAMTSGATVAFTLTNSSIAATDHVLVTVVSGASALCYNVWCDSVAAGSCSLVVKNLSGGSLSEAIVLRFTVIKAVSA